MNCEGFRSLGIKRAVSFASPILATSNRLVHSMRHLRKYSSSSFNLAHASPTLVRVKNDAVCRIIFRSIPSLTRVTRDILYVPSIGWSVWIHMSRMDRRSGRFTARIPILASWWQSIASKCGHFGFIDAVCVCFRHHFATCFRCVLRTAYRSSISASISQVSVHKTSKY